MSNTYIDSGTITAVKSFTVQAPGSYIIKFFTPVINSVSKLVCLPKGTKTLPFFATESIAAVKSLMIQPMDSLQNCGYFGKTQVYNHKIVFGANHTDKIKRPLGYKTTFCLIATYLPNKTFSS